MEIDKAIEILNSEWKKSIRNSTYQNPGKLDREEAFEMAISALERQREPEPRKLTLEELHEYIHKPVFIVSTHPLNCRSCWDIISHIDAEILYPRGTDYCYRLDKYGEAWVAYDRELKEE